jgi:hypothetical protein
MASSTTPTSREEIAEQAYLRAYGAHEGATEEQRAWGLKCSNEDALLALLGALYPEVFAGTGSAGIYTIRRDEMLSAAADNLDELEQAGEEALTTVTLAIPAIDEAMREHVLQQALALGVDVEEERFDSYFLANMLWEIGRLPERERAAAIRAVNDGATPEARHLYREEG